MTVPTVPVTVAIESADNQTFAGVTVRARLDVPEIYNSFIVSDEITGVTDVNGQVVLQLFPNAPPPSGLGTQGSVYRVHASIPGARSISVSARIPNIPCNLKDCLVEDEGVPLSASQQAALSAQNYAATATTQAGIATTAANTATTQAGIATTAATNASTSATNAATSEANAAASYDSFDDRYLGAKTSDPTLDNDGNTLLVGALYFNSTTGQMRVRTATPAWVNITIASSAFIATLLDDVDAPTARTTLGAGATGSTLFTAATAAAGRSTLGSGATGDSLFTAATAAAGRSTLGSGATGDSLFTAATAAAARTTLGSTATGDSLFTAASAASARTTLSAPSQAEVQGQTFTAFTTGGTGTAYTLTPSPSISAYAAGLSFYVNFNVASGASPTFTISGVATPPNLVKQLADGSYANIAAGDIQAGHRSRVTLISATQALVETFPSAGRLIGVQRITATSTYTPTAGTNSVVVEVQGGGGAGGGSQATGSGQIAGGGGGGAGGYAKSRLTSGFAGVTVTIGAGGTPAAGAIGGSGGTSSFGALLSCPGGGGGSVGTIVTPVFVGFSPGGGGGVGSGGNLVSSAGQPGGTAIYGSGTVLSGAGASSVFGGGAQSVSGTTAGAAANAGSYGAGGSGSALLASQTANSGGAGAPGVCIIWEYA